MRDLGLIPGLGRSAGEGIGYPPLPGGSEVKAAAWNAGDPGEKEMATHSSVLAWRIPGTEEPGGLPSMGHTESDTTEAT